MSKELDLVNRLIEGIDIYEKQTGRKNPPAYMNRETLVELQQTLLKAQEQEQVLNILKQIIKVKKSDLYGFELVIRGTDEQENIIKEWLDE